MDEKQYMGEIVRWRDDKGFGFIRCRELEQEVFFHISSYRVPDRRPEVGDKVGFFLTEGKNGKPQAERVQEWAFIQKKQAQQRRHQKYQAEFENGRKHNLYIALAIYAVLAAAVLSGKLPWTVSAWYAGVGLFTFLLYQYDKQAARNHAWRVPETKLHLFSLLGGWPAALLAQTYLRHKSQKTVFRIIYFATVAANIMLLVYAVHKKWFDI